MNYIEEERRIQEDEKFDSLYYHEKKEPTMKVIFPAVRPEDWFQDGQFFIPAPPKYPCEIGAEATQILEWARDLRDGILMHMFSGSAYKLDPDTLDVFLHDLTRYLGTLIHDNYLWVRNLPEDFGFDPDCSLFFDLLGNEFVGFWGMVGHPAYGTLPVTKT